MHKKSASLFVRTLAVAALCSIFSALFFEAAEHDHECTEEHCSICLMIQIVTSILHEVIICSALASFAAVFILKKNSFVFLRIFSFQKNLVKEKIKLND